jgi:signal transduction histidine kinase
MTSPAQDDAFSDKVQDLSGAIGTGLELEGTLNALIDLSKQLIDSSSCGIFKFEGPGVRLITTHNASLELERTVVQFHNEGRTDQVFTADGPVVLSEPDGDTTCALALISAQDRPLGIFAFLCQRSAYTTSEQDLIKTLSKQAAIALENVGLYQNLFETHQKLKASQSQLVQSGKMAAVGQLAAGVAHEVNNPLQIILSRVQLLMMRHKEEVRLVKDLDLIESNVKRISRIIRSLLDFARHNSGQEEWKSIDLIYLVTQTANLMQHLMEKGEIEVTIHAVDEKSPQIFGNVGEVEQIFLNLLLNARQAMPKGGKIAIELSTDGETTTAIVSDSGEGIPEENLGRIFDPFFTTLEEDGGTGLGLSIIYGIVDKHNGEVSVKSEVGAGTTFELRFPSQGPAEHSSDE